jgi:hypothetical protein
VFVAEDINSYGYHPFPDESAGQKKIHLLMAKRSLQVHTHLHPLKHRFCFCLNDKIQFQPAILFHPAISRHVEKIYQS